MQGIFLFLLLTPLAAFMMLRTAPMQTYMAHRVAAYLSNELNTEIVIGNFRLNWFLEAVITDISVLDEHKAILFKAKKIRANVKSINIDENKLHLNEIALTEADVNLIYYEADSCLNLQFLIDQFVSTETDTTPAAAWLLECNKIKLLSSHFAYRDERYMSPGRGIDFADMDFTKLNLEAKNIKFVGDTIMADIWQLTGYEKSGFELNDFSANLVACPRGLIADKLKITTDNSRLSLDLKFNYNSWDAYNYFIDSVRISASVEPSQLDMRDIVYFSPGIYGMEDIIDFSGLVRGTVSSFQARNFQFAFGKYTNFKGDIQLSGLPDLEETFVNLKIEELRSNVSDIQLFTLPFSAGTNRIKIPDEVIRLGNVQVKGRFTGFYNDFVSKATFVTDAGLVSTDLLLVNNKASQTNQYDGKILVESFNLGKVFNTTQFGTFSMFAVIKGENFSLEKADLRIKGEITNLQYEKNTIGLINVDGEFNRKRFTGGIYINDPLLGLDFVGYADFSEKLPSFDFHADVDHADLAKLNLLSIDSVVQLRTSCDFNFQGNTIDNLLGTLSFSNTSFTKGAGVLKMNDLSVATKLLGNGGKRMEINSDFANAVFSGQYTFDDMAEYMTMVLTDFLPSLNRDEQIKERLNRGSFDYTIKLKKTDSLTKMFAPWLKINPNTVVSGIFDPTLGVVNINGRSPMISVSGFAMHDWSLTASSLNKKLTLNMVCSEVNSSETSKKDTTLNRIEQFKLKAVIADDSVRFGFGWNDFGLKDHNKADIAGVLSFKQNPRLVLKIDQAELIINDSVWDLIPDNLLVYESSYLEARNFGLSSNGRQVVVNGFASPDPLSMLSLRLDGFNISSADMLTRRLGFDMDGYLQGNVSVSELFSVPRLTSDLSITKFAFNKENLGDAIIKSEWDNQNRLLALDMKVVYVGNVGTHFPVKVVGNIYPERNHDNFDLRIDVDNLKVKTIEPFLVGVFSRMRGYASGGITMTGDFADPVLKGKVNLMRTELLVDYLRTSYSFTGDFNFDKGSMWFKNIPLTDSTFGQGVVSGTIKHKAFSDWALDIALTADNLVALNTPYSPAEMYYGKAKTSGTMTLKGSIDNLVLRADVKSEKGTSVYIPISFSRSISENSFIQYRYQGDSIQPENGEKPYEASVLSLQLGLDVTRNADIGIILPYQMGTIDVRGSGLINMGIDTRGEYSMYGNYIMDNGDFMFNFENILKKNFEIQKGGSITFNGSPYDADINLLAVYKVKTNLASLPEIPEQYRGTRVNVDCIIMLSDNLYNPNIKFSIALPDATEDVKRSIFSIVDTSNTIEMNQQMISLLVLNTFSSSSGISTAGSSLGISTYDLISAQLSKMLSQISKDFDIGVNYRPGDALSPQELELALSTQLFNNRVTIDGAVGMNSYNDASQTTQIIGDVIVDYKITEDGRFRVKAFNRTNSTLEVYSGYSQYTQGVGVLFRKEFNSVGELFKRRKKVNIPNKEPLKLN